MGMPVTMLLVFWRWVSYSSRLVAAVAVEYYYAPASA